VPPGLFDPFPLRGITVRNRVAVAPMCMYCCGDRDGVANVWHVVHLGSRAVGGAGLVFTEAAAVEPRGRISAYDLGVWDDRHVDPLAAVARAVAAHGAVAGIQLAHAGRKGSVNRAWERPRQVVRPEDGGWIPVAPSPIAFSPLYGVPEALPTEEVRQIVAAFRAGAQRARAAGFQAVEVHAAHGYLLHEFLSPLSNHRSDRYGGSLENRMRLVLEVAAAVRQVWPDELPVFVRISMTDWAEPEGWTVEDSVVLGRELKSLGVDVIDCSAGLVSPQFRQAETPGYLAPLAERIRREVGIPVAVGGAITGSAQADAIVRAGQADLVMLARQELWDPYWPLHAAHALGVDLPYWPRPYHRALEPTVEKRSP
jgi:2,4-dienoyl-CoA reductase-like NADH-dependent reductase (Old Yellow Enzyme family)